MSPTAFDAPAIDTPTTPRRRPPRRARSRLPAHMRTPGFVLFALLPLPALLLLTLTTWQAFGLLAGLFIAWTCGAAVVFFVLAPLPVEEALCATGGTHAMPHLSTPAVEKLVGDA